MSSILERPLLYRYHKSSKKHLLCISEKEFPDGKPGGIQILSWEHPTDVPFVTDQVLVSVARADGVHLKLRAPIGGTLQEISGKVYQDGVIATFMPTNHHERKDVDETRELHVVAPAPRVELPRTSAYDEGSLIGGRYRVLRRIGTGTTSAVWQAQDEFLGRTVAIKQFEFNDAEDARQRTVREGQIAAQLHHPNVITVFDVATDEFDQPCLIMEYLNSTSLAEVLQTQGTLPPQEVARIGALVAAALKEAHAAGIVHCDIKPGNILLGGNGVVKITEFGTVRARHDMLVAGTPAYLAPEVIFGGQPVPESDIFSLGSTLYAACEGRPPFGLGENMLNMRNMEATTHMIMRPRKAGPLANVLAVLLHRDIHRRPTADESEQLLSAVARGETLLGALGG